MELERPREDTPLRWRVTHLCPRLWEPTAAVSWTHTGNHFKNKFHVNTHLIHYLCSKLSSSTASENLPSRPPLCRPNFLYFGEHGGLELGRHWPEPRGCVSPQGSCPCPCCWPCGHAPLSSYTLHCFVSSGGGTQCPWGAALVGGAVTAFPDSGELIKTQRSGPSWIP